MHFLLKSRKNLNWTVAYVFIWQNCLRIKFIFLNRRSQWCTWRPEFPFKILKLPSPMASLIPPDSKGFSWLFSSPFLILWTHVSTFFKMQTYFQVRRRQSGLWRTLFIGIYINISQRFESNNLAFFRSTFLLHFSIFLNLKFQHSSNRMQESFRKSVIFTYKRLFFQEIQTMHT